MSFWFSLQNTVKAAQALRETGHSTKGSGQSGSSYRPGNPKGILSAETAGAGNDPGRGPLP
jgi:hypothetical protein